MGKRYIFTVNSPEEYITAVDVRAGGWIDAIRFHTNYKSSVWMGGMGGDECCLRPSLGKNILGLMGTSGMYVGSLENKGNDHQLKKKLLIVKQVLLVSKLKMYREQSGEYAY